MNTPDPSAPAPSAESSSHRRSREEVEALAKSFVTTPAGEGGPAKPVVKVLMGAGAAAVLIIIAVLAWPKGQDQARVQAVEANTRAAADAEAARQRYEAERERVRQQLASGQDYLGRMAAADAELLKDMTERAEKLAQRAAAFAAEDARPTPREEPARVASTAQPTPRPVTTTASAPAPAPAKATTAPTTTAPAAAPPPTQVASAAPAQAAPTQVAQADKSQCAIHVSELTKSGKATYDDVRRMKGARFDEATGHVFTPPIQAAGGRSMVFEVFPNGCVAVRRV
ncbi:MAG: hypothetical protein ACT4PK_00855 [Gammaproteobacteria bacterium]